MPVAAEHKVKVSIGLTPRHITYFDKKAKAMFVSFGDTVRRALDQVIDNEERAEAETRAKHERILVLDREKGSIRAAR